MSTMHRKENIIKIYNWWAGDDTAAIVSSFVTRVEDDGGVVEAEDCLKTRIRNLKTLGLWNKASAVWLPHGYKESKLYAAKGGSGVDLGFTRAGTRYRKASSLVEQVPYNLLSRSEEFDNAAWSKADATITPNDTIAPDGTLTADRFVEAATTAVHTVNQPLTVVSGQRYTWSVHAKAGSVGRHLAMSGFGAGGVNEVVIFNLTNGTVDIPATTNVVKSAQIIAKTNGWYECIVEAQAASTTGLPSLHITNNATSNVATDLSYLGNGSFIHIWGAQVVIGSSARDYFKTTDRFNVPALDYTGSTCPALSLEPARTNLLLRSEEFDNASWIKTNSTVSANGISSPNNLSTADALFETTANGFHYLRQIVSKAASTLAYSLTAFVKPNGRDWVLVQVSSGANGVGKYFNISTGIVGSTRIVGTGLSLQNASIKAVANGFYRCEINITSDAATSLQTDLVISTDGSDAGVTYAGDITKGLYFYGAQLEQASYATSYIPTTSATVSRIADAIPALLPKGTNQLLQSQTFDNASWSVNAASVVANATTAPDGTLTADKINETATSNSHTVLQTVTKGAVETTYTFSVYAKQAERTWLYLTLDIATVANGARAYFDLANGVLGSIGALGYTTPFTNLRHTIEPAANGFYRCTFTATTNNSTIVRCLPAVSTGNEVVNYLGVVGNGIYLWGAQLEQGDEATTYVATTTVPVHNGTVIGQTEGTLYWEGSSFTDGTFRHIISVDDATVNNRMQIYLTTSNELIAFISTGGVTQANINFGAITNQLNYKIAFTYQGNKAAFFVNGVKVGEDLTVTVPATAQIKFLRYDNTLPFYGNGKAWAISKTALTDAEAIIWTTP